MSDTTQGFTAHTGTAVPLDQANVDTDQIIPKQFLTGVTRAGYGKHLFHDWRYCCQLRLPAVKWTRYLQQ